MALKTRIGYNINNSDTDSPAMTFIPASYSHDTTRAELIDNFRARIAAGERSKLSKGERSQLALHFVDALQGCETEADCKALCVAEMALLEEGYPVASIANQYLTEWRKAIALAVEEGRLPKQDLEPTDFGKVYPHWGLKCLTYPNEIQQAIKQKTTIKNNIKQDDLQPIRADRFIRTAKDLLDAETPYEVAVGVAALTGRRFSEVVAKGEFKPTSHPYAIAFRGQLKKGIVNLEDAPTFLIATLTDAATVLAAIEKFRTHPRIQEMAGLDPDEINSRLNTSVRHHIKREFEDAEILPLVAGEKSVSAHNLRGAYAEIATHFFCPPNQGTHRFIQAHLGHVIGESELANRKNAGATEHYFHYRLVGAGGHQLNEKGILIERVGALPTTVEFEPELNTPEQKAIEVVGVEIMATAKVETVETVETAIAPKNELHNRKSRASVPTGLMSELKELAEKKLNASGSNAEVLESIIQFLKDDVTPTIAASVESFGSTFQWFTHEIERLRAENQQLSKERDQAQVMPQHSDELDSLRAENERLSAELAQFQQFKQMLVGGTAVMPQPVAIAPSPTPSYQPVQPRQTAVVGKPSQKRIRNEEEALGRIDEAISLIMAWNDDPIREFGQKWYIGVPALLDIFRGNNYSVSQGRIVQALASRRDEIEQHHTLHGLGQRHNVRHDLPISDDIAM